MSASAAMTASMGNDDLLSLSHATSGEGRVIPLEPEELK
jgi:hypothetical protein